MPNAQSKIEKPPSLVPKSGPSNTGQRSSRYTDAEAANMLLLYPSMDKFWNEFTQRRKEMKKPQLEAWFKQNAVYVPERRSEDESGNYANKMSCGVCSNNWSGWPVMPHSGNDCPIPPGYQQIFMATNTPATCPNRFGRVEWHTMCKRSENVDRYCHKCMTELRVRRPHVPMAKMCDIPPGDELAVFNAHRLKYYKNLVEESKKSPFKLKLVNDMPLKPRPGPQVKLYGLPPLTGIDLPPVQYTDGAEFAGLLGVYQTVERNLVTSQIIALQQESPAIPLFPVESPEKHRFYESEAVQSDKTWDELEKAVETYWTVLPGEVEALANNLKDVKDIQQDTGDVPANEETWSQGAYRKREFFEELFYKTYTKDKSVVTKIKNIQHAITGDFENEITIQRNLVEKDQRGLVPYYEFLRDLAMIIHQSENAPLVILQPHHIKTSQWRVLKNGNNVIPSSTAFTNTPFEYRFSKCYVFLCQMAGSLEMKNQH